MRSGWVDDTLRTFDEGHVRAWRRKLRASCFGVLFRVFLARVVDLEILSGDADTSRLVGQFLTIFLGLSCLFSVPVVFAGLGSGRMSHHAAWTIEHFLIATTMVVAGLMSILTWDAAFPDRHDLLVLAPLPVRARTLFWAKTAALFAGPGIAIVALNAATGLLWPMLLTSGHGGWAGALRAWPAYWLTTAAAGVFIFCGLLAVQGLAANLLPRQLFLRTSAAIQAAVLCLLLSVYFLEPSLESVAALSAPANQRLLHMLPTYWFLGMFQWLNGSMHPAMAPLALRAWVALGAAIGGAAIALLLAYSRVLPRILEQPEIVATRPVLFRSPVGRASLSRTLTLFSFRTLTRSRHHRVILSFYIGVGLTILVAYLRTQARAVSHDGVPVRLLVVSMMLVILAVVAMRVVASIPISLNANWVFRVTQVRRRAAYDGAVRTSWILLALVPAWTAIGIAFAAVCAWRPLTEHLGLLLMGGILLIEAFAAGFAKIPFACSYLPGKANLHFVFWVGLASATWALRKVAVWEQTILRNRYEWAATVAGLAGCWLLLRWGCSMRTRTEDDMMFEENYPPVMTSLELGG